MMKFKFLLILLITHCSLVATLAPLLIVNAQVSQEWVARYHFYSDDQAIAIALDNAGNVYVTGRSDASTPNGLKPDYATIKYNSAGVQQWVMRYNGPGNDFDAPQGIAVDDSGNVYVTGVSNRFSFPSQDNYDIATIKYNTNGVQQWVRRYQGGGDESATAGIVYTGGYIYVGGRNNSIGSDYLVIKYNTTGDSLWVRLYDSGGNDNAYDYPADMAADTAGNVYITGAVGLNNFPAPDWATVKWNSQGVFQWVQRYNGPGNGSDYPQAISVSDSGNVYVTGYVWRNNHVECVTIKYNILGVQQWVVFTGYESAGLSISCDDSGNVYVAAASYGYRTIKYDSYGVQQWSSYLSNTNAQPCCLKLDDSGNVYVTGYATVSTNNRDYCTIKYNNSGAQQWVMYYNGTGNSFDQASGLATDSNGNVYVTGPSRGPGNNDFATVKYSQLIGIQPISNEIPNQYNLEQNYPNPFNPVTSIKFMLKNAVFVNLSIYDILGRKIETLVNDELKPGIYEIKWNGSDFPSGIYYYKLVVNSPHLNPSQEENYVDTKKMVLLK
ncbi:MAG TPA: SBBP repeat-containing protein [Ignavibacteria bacterium]|jgi:hypothetical protein